MAWDQYSIKRQILNENVNYTLDIFTIMIDFFLFTVNKIFIYKENFNTKTNAQIVHPSWFMEPQKINKNF